MEHKSKKPLPYPFTASISGDQLTLKCTSPDYDINITIVNANGQPVWQRDIAAPETSLFPFLSTAYLKVVTRLKSAMITVVTYKVHFSFNYGKERQTYEASPFSFLPLLIQY